MIIIEFYDGQGLGNQLWFYVAMRTISKKLNLPFIVLGSDRFKAKDFLNIDYGEIQLTEEVLKRIEKNKINYFKEKMYLDLELDCFCIDYDEKVLNIKPYTKIDGYFQSEKYFFDDFKYFKTLLPFKRNFILNSLIDENTCVLNIRGGEYKNNINLILPKSYWQNAINNINKKYTINKFLIVSDDHEYCKELFPDIKIIKEGIAESYTALNQVKYLIVSNSSFSYFPIKTQKLQPFVIAPLYWARFNNKFKRWASPANLYKDWYWQDNSGDLFTYDECLSLYENNMLYYNTYYNIRTTEEITKHFNSFSIKKYIPNKLKDIIKKVLPYSLAKKIAFFFS